MTQIVNKQNDISTAIPVLAAGYLGPSLQPNRDALWEEALLPLNADDLVQEIMGQPMRRAGRFIKVVCCGALVCLKKVAPEYLKGKKIGIFLATGLGNVDEILPFITEVFKHEGGFPSPNQFANSVSNAAAFFLARICEVKGVVLTISQEELSFEAALWLAQSYLESGEIDLALVGGCDVFTPTIEEYRERMDLKKDNSRKAPMGEGSSWLLLGANGVGKIGDILPVTFGNNTITPQESSFHEAILNQCEKIAAGSGGNHNNRKVLLPGFRLNQINSFFGEKSGWEVEDYLPYCGIHPTAAAFGITRAMLAGVSSLYVHYNFHTSGKYALVAATTEPKII